MMRYRNTMMLYWQLVMNRLLSLSNDEVIELCKEYEEDLYDLAIRAMNASIESEFEPDEVLAMILYAAFAAGRKLEAEGHLERSEK